MVPENSQKHFLKDFCVNNTFSLLSLILKLSSEMLKLQLQTGIQKRVK